jgi:DNA-binding NarL/FixJ family response regulator
MRVLLVDDHPLFQEGLRNLLVSEGIQVIGLAHDGLEALAQARRLHPEVILMDIQMPRCDGVSATRLIKAEMPEIKIVMLTMSEDDQDLFEAVKSGASGYLLKRLEAADFFIYLTELQAGHPPFSPGLAEKILKEFSQQGVRDMRIRGNEDAETRGLGPTGVLRDDTEKHDTVNKRGGDPERTQGRRGKEEKEETGLSTRQVQILTLVAQGQTYRQVAETLGIAERTVKYHMSEILENLHLQNRAQVIAYAARMGMTRGEKDKVEGER